MGYDVEVPAQDIPGDYFLPVIVLNPKFGLLAESNRRIEPELIHAVTDFGFPHVADPNRPEVTSAGLEFLSEREQLMAEADPKNRAGKVAD